MPEWINATDFLTNLATRSGKLLKGGEPDLDTVAKMVLYDWQRGKLPWFTTPPLREEEEETNAVQAEPHALKAEADIGALSGAANLKHPIEEERSNVLKSFAHLLDEVRSN